MYIYVYNSKTRAGARKIIQFGRRRGLYLWKGDAEAAASRDSYFARNRSPEGWMPFFLLPPAPLFRAFIIFGFFSLSIFHLLIPSLSLLTLVFFFFWFFAFFTTNEVLLQQGVRLIVRLKRRKSGGRRRRLPWTAAAVLRLFAVWRPAYFVPATHAKPQRNSLVTK